MDDSIETIWIEVRGKIRTLLFLTTTLRKEQRYKYIRSEKDIDI